MDERAVPVWHETQPSAPAAPSALDIRFTGSGSEYFRIWIVNLLLTLVTLGIYYPWAKVRRLRYFHGNTLVGGHALGFHADPMKMLRGYALVGVMALLYSVAGQFSPVAGLAALLIVAAVWPALIKSSMQFRLANTSWRGLRFRFRGTLAGAYRAVLPLFVPGLVIVAAVAFVTDQQRPPTWYVVLVFVVMASVLLVGPRLWWNLKKYQHDHYAFGAEQTRLEAGVGSFYGVFLKTIGVSILAMIAFGVLVFVVGTALGLGGLGPRGLRGGGLGMAFILGLVAFFLGLFVVQLVPRPYFTSRMQNLLWSRTASAAIAFDSRLRFWPLLGLTVKNWLLMVLTLGLYWPFAAVALARLRLQAVSLTLAVDPQRLVDDAAAAEGEAAGDAAGDLFGLDIGL